MSCSACTANTLQRFIGSFAVSTASATAASQARILSTIGARRDFNTSYGQQITDAGGIDANANTFESPDSVAFNHALASATSSEPRVRQEHRHQQSSGRKVLWQNKIRDEQGEPGVIATGIPPAHALEISRLRQTYSRLGASGNSEKSLDARWRGDNTTGFGHKNTLDGRGSGDADAHGAVSKIYSPSLKLGRPQASRENASEDRPPSVQSKFSVKNDGRTKSWSALGRHPKGSITSEVDRNQQREREPWQSQKSALSVKFGQTGWAPRKRLSPDTIEGIRGLHAQYPDKYTTPVLADQFQVSPEAIRRILKSTWRPNDKEEEERRARWNKRGEGIWTQMAEMGVKPPKKWRRKGIGRLSELIARGQYPAPLKWRPRMNSGAERSTTGLAPPSAPVLESRRYQVPLADRIL